MTSAVARIVAREIDRETFAPFGQLLETPGEGWRLDFAAAISDGRRVSRPNLALIRARPAPERLRIDRLECHPYSSQAFFPLDVERYLVVVCHDDGAGHPDLRSVAAFQVKGTQAINYNVGTWHYGMTTIGRLGTFAMFIFEGGSSDDCHFQAVMPFEISL
jgi:ureidoglycolate lyase